MAAEDPNFVRQIVSKGRVAQNKDKDIIEKSRLKERSSGFVRYDANVIDAPFSVPDSSVGYLENSERFHTDVAGEERRERDIRLSRDKLIDQAKRTVVLQREESRWTDQEVKESKETNKWETLRSDPKNQKALRNVESMPYNPVSLEYNDSVDGRKLKYTDDLVQHRAAERSENLRSHMNGSHNVITGEEHQRVTIPDKPSANFSKASHGK